MTEVLQSPDIKYTKEHEWVKSKDDAATVGITDYAQEQLGDIVYVELPAVGTEITQFESFGSIESVKAASDLYAPISGTVAEINADLNEHPELVNQSPYEQGWLLKVTPKDRRDFEVLMTPSDYQSFTESLAEE